MGLEPCGRTGCRWRRNLLSALVRGQTLSTLKLAHINECEQMRRYYYAVAGASRTSEGTLRGWSFAGKSSVASNNLHNRDVLKGLGGSKETVQRFIVFAREHHDGMKLWQKRNVIWERMESRTDGSEVVRPLVRSTAEGPIAGTEAYRACKQRLAGLLSPICPRGIEGFLSAKVSEPGELQALRRG
ncbi:hypothetical protein BDW71DRAFT_80281 [Aspergillus fruticulosus]